MMCSYTSIDDGHASPPREDLSLTTALDRVCVGHVLPCKGGWPLRAPYRNLELQHCLGKMVTYSTDTSTYSTELEQSSSCRIRS